MSVGIFGQWKQEGLLEGLRLALLLHLETRFGTVPDAVRERINQLPLERTREVLAAAYRAQSLDELNL